VCKTVRQKDKVHIEFLLHIACLSTVLHTSVRTQKKKAHKWGQEGRSLKFPTACLLMTFLSPLTFWPASLPKAQSYNMAASTEQNGYLKDGHEHSLFQTDRQSTLLEHSHGQGYEPMTTGNQFTEWCRKLLLPSAWSVQPKDTSHVRKMYMLQG
jgi:hypothetical protein